MSGNFTSSNLFANTIKVSSSTISTTSASYQQNFYIKPPSNAAAAITTFTTANNSTNFLFLSASIISNSPSNASATLIVKFNIRNQAGTITGNVAYGTERNASASLNTVNFTAVATGANITINVTNGNNSTWMVLLSRIESVV